MDWNELSERIKTVGASASPDEITDLVDFYVFEADRVSREEFAALRSLGQKLAPRILAILRDPALRTILETRRAKWIDPDLWPKSDQGAPLHRKMDMLDRKPVSNRV